MKLKLFSKSVEYGYLFHPIIRNVLFVYCLVVVVIFCENIIKAERKRNKK